jgi:hypothetical protein
MRIILAEGVLQFKPESAEEESALATFARSLQKTKKEPPKAITIMPSGSTMDFASVLGCEALLETGVRNHQPSPSGFPSKGNHQEHIVGIGKPLQIVANRNRSSRGS